MTAAGAWGATMAGRQLDRSAPPGRAPQAGRAAAADMVPRGPNSPAEVTTARQAPPTTSVRARLDRLEARVADWLARHGIPLLRAGLGVVFLWFGALKFFPGMSPGEGLAGRTIDALSGGLIPPQVSLPLLAATETLIGLGLVSGICLRVTLLALVAQMAGTLTPLVLFPAETFARVPYAPTLEGQYILKNIVLVAAALVIGATVRGGRLVAHPARTGAPAAPAPGRGARPDGADVPTWEEAPACRRHDCLSVGSSGSRPTRGSSWART